MDVGVVTTSFPRSPDDWAGRFVLDQAWALRARGHGVSVIAPGDAGSARREEFGGVGVCRVSYMWPRRWQALAYGAGMPENVRSQPWVAAQLPLLIAALRRGAARVEADVLLAHWALAGLAAGPVARRRRLGLATTLNGSDLRLALTRPLWRRAVVRALDASHRTLVLGSAMAQQVIESGLAPAGKVLVVPFGVADELLEREVGPGESGRILFVGRLVASKGLRELAEAAGRLAGGGARLVCVGAGPLRGELEALGHVTCTGPLDREALLDEVARAAIVALPSYGEGLPITLLEAMALARPVVATPVGAVPELLRAADDELGVLPAREDRRAGVLVGIGDVDGLAAALEGLLEDEAARRECGARARERIREGYSWSRAAARLEDALAGAAREAGRAAGPAAGTSVGGPSG